MTDPEEVATRWQNLRKRFSLRQEDYAQMTAQQKETYSLHLDQLIGRSERITLAQNVIAHTARREAQRIVLLAMEMLNADHARINVVTRHRQVTIASTDVAVDAPGSTRGREHGWCQHVIGTGDVLAINDASTHALVRDTDAAAKGTVGAYLGVPLLIEGEIVGALCVFDDRPRVWTDSEVTRLVRLGDAAAQAGRASSWNPQAP